MAYSIIVALYYLEVADISLKFTLVRIAIPLTKVNFSEMSTRSTPLRGKKTKKVQEANPAAKEDSIGIYRATTCFNNFQIIYFYR